MCQFVRFSKKYGKIWHVSTHTYVVLENIPFTTKIPFILLMLAFSAFFGKSCVRVFLVLLSVFVRYKVTISENVFLQTLRPESGFQIAPNWLKIKKMTMTSQFSDITSPFFFCFFWRWSKFHVNIITGSAIMTIFFSKGLTRNLEIGNPPVWVLHNIWRLGQVRYTKFGTSISNKKLLNAAKCQGYSFYRFLSY